MSARRRVTFFTNKGAEEKNIELHREGLMINRKNRVPLINKKFDDTVDHYKKKLNDLIHEHFIMINSDTTPEQLEAILKQGDKKWKAICARARQTDKTIKLDINAFTGFLTDVMKNEN